MAIALFVKRKGEKTKYDSLDTFATLSEAKGLNFSNKNIDSSASPQNDKVTKCKVYHSEIWGLREKKYDWLLEHHIRTTNWQKLSPRSEFFLFIPREDKLSGIYQKYLKITDIFPVNSVGITTARDELTIRWTPEEAWNTVLNFSRLDAELARLAYNLGKDARDWKVELAQKDLKESGLDKRKIAAILYRPFDTRFTYYTGKSRGFHCRPRFGIMRHMMEENLGIITNRQVNGKFMHVLCSNLIINDCTVSLETRERSYLFPLYLYPEVDKEGLFKKKKKINVSLEVLAGLSEVYKREPPPEEIFEYIYAVLYSDTYR